MPISVKKCIESWKIHMPQYEIKLWDSTKIKKLDNTYLREAYKCKKWAFASDYIRLYALYNEGGIYLDSDVYVRQSFDKFLSHDFFSAIEHCLSTKTRTCNIEAAVMGSVPGHPFIKECLNVFNDRKFILPNGSFDQYILPEIVASVAEKFQFKRIPNEQSLPYGMHIYGPDVIAHAYLESFSDKKCIAVHLCDGGWYKSDVKFHKRAYSLLRRFIHNPVITTYMLFWKHKFNNEIKNIKIS